MDIGGKSRLISATVVVCDETQEQHV